MSSVLYNRKSNTQMHFYNTNINAAVKMLKYQNIAPAPPTMTAGDLKTRKYTPRASNAPYSVDQTQSVQRRNARERNRVKQVNNSFARLRQHIPQTIIMDLTKGGGRGPHKKISKVDTLRIAVEYIRRLQDLVDDLNGGHSHNSSSSSIINNSNSNRCLSDTTSNSSFSSSSSSSSTLTDAPSPLPNAPNASNAQTEQMFYAQTFQQQLQQQQQQQFGGTTLLTAEALQVYTAPAPASTQLEAACHSPTSSFNSSMSFDSGTFEPSPQQQQLSPMPTSGGQSAPNTSALNANLQLKFEPYDGFSLNEEDCTPDDEEILDYISLWQEQ